MAHFQTVSIYNYNNPTMKTITNLYLVTAILLTSNLLALCEGGSGIDHDPFPDHLDHLDDLHDIVGPISDNDKVIHRVELVEHNGDTLTKYATTSHTNQETKNEIFPNTITTIQQPKVPASFTKVIKKTVIKQSNNDGNSSPEIDLSMNDMYSINKLKENGISNSMSKSQTLSQMDHMENIGLPTLPLQKTSNLQGNIKNIIHTTVTKTTSSGSPSNKLNESFNRIHSLDGLSSNNIISTMSSTNSNFNDGTAISGSLQSNSMEGSSNIKKMIDGNGINKSKRISRKPVGSFRRTKTTIIKQHSIDDDNDRGDLDKSNTEFNTENISSNNVASSMTNPLGFNTITTTTINRGNSNNNAFNQGIPTRRENTRFNKFNGNSVSESKISQNPGSFVQTKTTIIKNGRVADEIKLDDLNGGKIDYGIDSGISNSNNNIYSNYIGSSRNNGNDEVNSNSNFSFNDGYMNNYNGNYNSISENKYNGNIMSSDMLDNEYVLEYSNGNGKRKKRKKKGSTKKYQGGMSKNISYGSRKGNGQRIVKNGSNYKSTRSSKTRNGGSSRYYSSNSYVKGQSKSLSSSESASDEISTGKKMSCHCKNKQKLNKRNSSESNKNSYSRETFGAENHYLSNSINNQQMKNNGDFISPPFMGRESPPNLMFNMILGQQPDQLFNDSQLDEATVLNRQGETKSQQIDDHYSIFMPDFKIEEYSRSLGLDKGSSLGPVVGHGHGPGPGHGPGKGHGPGTGHGPGPGLGPGPGPGKGPNFGSGFGPGTGHGPGPGLGPGPGPGKGPNFGSGFGPGKDSGQEANLFYSRSFYNDNFFDPRPSPPPQFPYPYSFNKDNYSDFSKMDITTPGFMDIQSGQENQVNINTILPQTQQARDNEDSRSNMIKNINSDPNIEYKKIIETANNIEDNSIPDRHVVQMLSVPPQV